MREMLAESSSGAWWIGGLLITALLAPSWLSWWNSHLTKQQMRTNGGSTFRDAIEKMAAEQKAHNTLVLARLDSGAQVLGNHSDRLAILESRPCPHDPNPNHHPGASHP